MIEVEFLKENKIVKTSELNFLKCLNVKHSSPEIEYNNLSFISDDGERESNNSTFNPFNIEMRFIISYSNQFNKRLIFSEILTFLSDKKSYYLVHDYMPGKKYCVQFEGYEEEEKFLRYSIVNFRFKVFKGYSESIESTLCEQDITNQKWQFSQGLIPEDYQYTFDKNKFSVFNLGDFTIDPRKKHNLKIKLTGRSEGDVTIFNQTTGERFIFKNKLSKEQKDELTIESIHCYKNGVISNISTNGELITLVPGENKFLIENVSQVKISFDTRFLYKT